MGVNEQMEIILVRHGETPWNREERVQGISDIELSEEGRDQARRLATALREKAFGSIYSSPLSRALETARIINIHHGLSIQVREELREMDQGVFEGMSFRELMEKEGEFLSRWIKDPASVTMPGGESLLDVQRRAWPVVEEILERGENSLIVSHSFTLSTIICGMAGIPLSRFRRVSVSPASLSIIRFEGGSCRIEKINDCRHLA
ncbi:MAG: histidine phosphatase family protein [Syntrophales bacterium]|nr:histidine phosphatase family protein [Syntrophales bacterium]